MSSCLDYELFGTARLDTTNLGRVNDTELHDDNDDHNMIIMQTYTKNNINALQLFVITSFSE